MKYPNWLYVVSIYDSENSISDAQKHLQFQLGQAADNNSTYLCKMWRGTGNLVLSGHS